MELQAYLPAGWAVVLALAFCGLFVALAVLIGPKRKNAIKAGPFECGMDPIGSPRSRYSVKFYQVAILFLVFDIEAAFMYPWAVLYRRGAEAGDFSLSVYANGQATFFGFAEMMLFVGVLVVALAYVWRKKAIGWD